MEGGYLVMIDCSSYNPWIIWSLKLQGLDTSTGFCHDEGSSSVPWGPIPANNTANFSVNKTIQMKEYTEDFICKDDAVCCIILHFFRSTTSVWYTHNYRPCTVTEAQTIPVSITIMPTPWTPQDALFKYNKYHTIAIMSYRGIHDLGHSMAFPYQLRKIFIAFLSHSHSI